MGVIVMPSFQHPPIPIPTTNPAIRPIPIASDPWRPERNSPEVFHRAEVRSDRPGAAVRPAGIAELAALRDNGWTWGSA
ncbi:hypothetical protein BKA25_001418 [Actinoalloteichus hymeniacidonis]|uniref:Uncharacterized protein n=1 Tax=Actinoalloteichus hymeniacidonis TaxID=340345 RepID=A0AAC9HSW2_9PSEU|nr:hypothetical protein TL08_20160 [Actinoalloteichus hymeniacidonis]MBB5907102.1 hypothetical protein [Actinoalloteichus hymeniacidonis]